MPVSVSAFFCLRLCLLCLCLRMCLLFIAWRATAPTQAPSRQPVARTPWAHSGRYVAGSRCRTPNLVVVVAVVVVVGRGGGTKGRRERGREGERGREREGERVLVVGRRGGGREREGGRGREGGGGGTKGRREREREGAGERERERKSGRAAAATKARRPWSTLGPAPKPTPSAADLAASSSSPEAAAEANNPFGVALKARALPLAFAFSPEEARLFPKGDAHTVPLAWTLPYG